MNKRGKIYTFTVITSAAEDFRDKVPYAIAVVEEENRKALAFIEGYSDDMKIAVGQEVEFIRNDERGNPIYKFV